MINGIAPKDLAQTAVLEVIKTYHQVMHLKTEDDIFRTAYQVMRHDFLDLIKSAAYKKNKRIEEISGGNSGNETIPTDNGKFLEFDDESAVKKFYELANGEEDLIDFISAVLEIKVYKREEIAELLNITPQEVTNRQRKLNYRYISNQKKVTKSEKIKTK